MFVVRACAGVSVGLGMVVLSGCSSWVCSETTAERGEAAVRVEVEDATGRLVGATAEVVGWRLEPHPQVPAEGDQVHFRFRFHGGDEGSGPAVDACAVDDARVALGCRTVHASQAFGPGGDPTGDDYLAVEHPERVAAVLMIPNDQSVFDRRTCEDDPKDGGGAHPPEPAGAGDRL